MRAPLAAPRPGEVLAAVAAGGVTLAVLALAATLGGSFEVFRHSPSALAFAGLASAAAGVEALASRHTVQPSPVFERDDARTARVLGAATGLLLLILSTAPLALLSRAPIAPWPALVGLGAALMILGSGLRSIAIGQLGARFTSTNTVAPGAALERDGLYRLFAHPSEVGLLAFVAGGLCLVGRPGWWTLAAVFYGLSVLRLALEERALVRRHGQAYRAYRARRLDPFPTLIQFVRGTTK
jgi:protein-S-isoprenylcysteine O-methyltransferase Ste14